MTAIRRLTSLLLATAGVVGCYLTWSLAAPASPAPPNDGNAFTQPPIAPHATPTTPAKLIITTGSPWWTFVVVAIAACAVTLLAGLLIGKLRRTHPTPQMVAH